MKVINYGPGYEPDTMVCEQCKSEMEYTKDDVRKNDFYIDLCGFRHNWWDGKTFCYYEHEEYLHCPVCSHKIIFKIESCPIQPPVQLTPTKEEPKKRKWFSRKEN
jgi:DNA-directed RNA polymerase subunit RPC12/RpoP